MVSVESPRDHWWACCVSRVWSTGRTGSQRGIHLFPASSAGQTILHNCSNPPFSCPLRSASSSLSDGPEPHTRALMEAMNPDSHKGPIVEQDVKFTSAHDFRLLGPLARSDFSFQRGRKKKLDLPHLSPPQASWWSKCNKDGSQSVTAEQWTFTAQRCLFNEEETGSSPVCFSSSAPEEN